MPESTENRYTRFIIILEFVYAILMAWGFARIAEFFKFESVFDWAVLAMATLVLIRFFFAPSHNVGALIYALPMNAGNARKIIFTDIPILIAHSFLYYRMCYNAAAHRYDLFYFDLTVLLMLNSAWLFWIRKRLESARAAVPEKFHLWVTNNLVFAALLAFCWALFKAAPAVHGKVLLSFNAYFWISFVFVLSNCAIDLSSCALDYLEDT